MLDCTLVIAGSAGEGIQTIGDVLADALSAHGYAVFTWQEYESRIRGGQNTYTIRVRQDPCNAPTWEADILLCLNQGAYEKAAGRLKDGGILLAEEPYDKAAMVVPFKAMAQERLGRVIYANTIAAGALAGVLGMERDALEEVLGREFAAKGLEVVEANRQAARLGYDAADAACRDACPWSFPKRSGSHYLVTGNEALPMGAVRAGCRFIAAYPMTPSTGVITFLAKRSEELGIFCEQAEDEIGAINMALGASFAGARAMTTTSGGGFALMVEGISLSGMTEVPVVIVLAQRPGPATGLPTRTAQGDLLFAVHAGHGEFPKAVLAPADPKDAFHKMVRAFNLADRFQIPVIVLSDQFLADSRFTITDFEMDRSRPESFLADPESLTIYKRYALTDDGVSPRLVPGMSHHLVTADSDEHDEWGHITEDLAETVPAMMAKRLRKAQHLCRAMKPPEAYRVEDAREVFCSWGATRGAVLEAVDRLRKEAVPVGILHWTELWPLAPVTFPQGARLWTVENNATAQLASLLGQGLGLRIDRHILRSDGLPLTARYIRRAYHERA
ncbi:2-oxoglutarate ferredoxin oxidoreductase subunit alpha [Desulfacinum hydrothermale DSM 13146]|uniref:2-oxoglutarate ferredoxin oxidoreductase subunit alpha n=1 Tax=Desulfacinum hydrothermale DSM 13146 TaxID=1121390 RepID=A0A1W1XKE1_9BACT|nr:2-oxoacid:acceptor oxidoreductase subunit alpha [Desulfacinum hydrothermale]SMC24453.1 2-oxoglutarate ferredoxin oxidoreductase subunit alpha [Desulfacinum hydrothermale DSM 13146]